MTSFYTQEELSQLGLKSYGTDVMISRKSSIYGAENITVGSHVRIDDFCILSGNITLHNDIHISAYSALFAGNAGIELSDFTTLSSRTTIYAISDDYSGASLTNPLIPVPYRNVKEGPVQIKKWAIIGSSCVVLPGVTLGEGCAVGAMSLVSKSLTPWGIYGGVPAKKLKDRKQDMIALAEQYHMDRKDE